MGRQRRWRGERGALHQATGRVAHCPSSRESRKARDVEPEEVVASPNMLVLASLKLLRYLVLGPLVASASPPSLQRRDVLGGAIGLGDIADQYVLVLLFPWSKSDFNYCRAYLVSVTIGNSTVPLRLGG